MVNIKQKDNYYEFTVEELKDSLSVGGDIVVPPYQRGITWKESQRISLIDTLLHNYPFGCILLNRYDSNKYRIIDGLQRSYSLIYYLEHPLEFFIERNIPEVAIDEIALLTKDFDIKDDIRLKVPGMIVDYVKRMCDSIEKLKALNTMSLTANIINAWPQLIETEKEINNIIKNVIIEFCNNYDKITKELKIPALIFEAPEENLPEIFERINTEGSKLTRFQVYAATWSDDKVELDGKEFKSIFNYIKNRYDSYLKEFGTLDNYDSVEFTRNNKLNIFDLIYGFGRMLSTDHPTLFVSKPDNEWDENDVPSIGFNLINACLLQKSSNMGKLNKTIEKLVGFDKNSISAFLHNIIECVCYVDKKLSMGTSLKGNKNIDSWPSPLHTELQIVSIIASLFISKYVTYEEQETGEITNITISRTCNQKWKNYYKNKFDNNVLKIYSNDLIRSNWRGSGDSKLYNTLINKKHYMWDISWEEFQNTLDSYYITQKNERNEKTKVANPSNADKLILNLIYSSILTAGDQIDDSGFDIEHLATKGKLKSKIKEYIDTESGAADFSLPISSVANLCLLPKEYNELKGEKVMYEQKEYYDRNEHVSKEFPIGKYEKKYTFTHEKDFDWLLDPDKGYTSEEFKKKYDDFLDNRFKKMKNKIKKNLFPFNI